MDYVHGQHQPCFGRMGLKKRLIIIWPSIIIFSPDYVITSMTILYFEAKIKERTSKILCTAVGCYNRPENNNASALLGFSEFSGLDPHWSPRSLSTKTCKVKSQMSSGFLRPLSSVRKRLERSVVLSGHGQPKPPHICGT